MARTRSASRAGRAALLCTTLALAAASGRAAPLPAAATRADAVRWLEELRAAGARTDGPLAWVYSFGADRTAPLEALSLELVTAGYAIESLVADSADARLVATRSELLTAAGLERRARELQSLARRHGARYVGVDTVAGSRR